MQLEVPAGWQVTPVTQKFALAQAGEKTRLEFSLTAPARPATAVLGAVADVGGIRCRTGRKEIRYDHIPFQLLQPTAHIKAVSLEVATRGKNVGYLPGAGDDIAHALTHLGYTVTELTGADLTAERLKSFDAVVIGVRAFNVRTDLVPGLPALFAYVEGGGTVVAQYNRPGRDLKTEQLAPYSLRLSNDRVTDENAAVTFLAPDHPALNVPNKITAEDFAGWVQERGVYFPEPVGSTFHGDPRVRRPRRGATQERAADRAAWSGIFRLHRVGVLPAVARRRAGRVSPLRESDFTWKMKVSQVGRVIPNPPFRNSPAAAAR
jgi:hypothetical protein